MTCGAYHEAFGAVFVSGAREQVGGGSEASAKLSPLGD